MSENGLSATALSVPHRFVSPLYIWMLLSCFNFLVFLHEIKTYKNNKVKLIKRHSNSNEHIQQTVYTFSCNDGFVYPLEKIQHRNTKPEHSDPYHYYYSTDLVIGAGNYFGNTGLPKGL